jgi:hypothetical protein
VKGGVRVQEFGFRSSGVQGFRGSGVQGFREFRSSGVQFALKKGGSKVKRSLWIFLRDLDVPGFCNS